MSEIMMKCQRCGENFPKHLEILGGESVKNHACTFCGFPNSEIKGSAAVGGKFIEKGTAIGELVEEKNKAYGDAFNKAGEFLKILYPEGVKPEQYKDMLGIVRVYDKLMRIATHKGAFDENPWEDIAGYSILKSALDDKT